MKRPIRLTMIPMLFLIAGLSAVKPARADFLYDFQVFNGTTHIEFTEPALLTSVTTVTDFLTIASSEGLITSLVLDPAKDGGSCPPVKGPCFEAVYANGSLGFDTYASPFTATGTYVGTLVGSTLTISATPEPNSLLLLLTSSLAIAALVCRTHVPRSKTAART